MQIIAARTDSDCDEVPAFRPGHTNTTLIYRNHEIPTLRKVSRFDFSTSCIGVTGLFICVHQQVDFEKEPQQYSSFFYLNMQPLFSFHPKYNLIRYFNTVNRLRVILNGACHLVLSGLVSSAHITTTVCHGITGFNIVLIVKYLETSCRSSQSSRKDKYTMLDSEGCSQHNRGV